MPNHLPRSKRRDIAPKARKRRFHRPSLTSLGEDSGEAVIEVAVEAVVGISEVLEVVFSVGIHLVRGVAIVVHLLLHGL